MREPEVAWYYDGKDPIRPEHAVCLSQGARQVGQAFEDVDSCNAVEIVVLKWKWCVSDNRKYVREGRLISTAIISRNSMQ